MLDLSSIDRYQDRDSKKDQKKKGIYAHPGGVTSDIGDLTHNSLMLGPLILYAPEHLEVWSVWGSPVFADASSKKSIRSAQHGCKEFRCKQREFCVSADLKCDGVDHCADGSDEDTALLCPETGNGGMERAWLVVSGAAGVLVVLAGAAVACCACRRRTAHARRSHLQPTAPAAKRWRRRTACRRTSAAPAVSERARWPARLDCRETGRTLRARAGTGRRARAASARGPCAERAARAAQGRVVRLRRPGRPRRGRGRRTGPRAAPQPDYTSHTLHVANATRAYAPILPHAPAPARAPSWAASAHDGSFLHLSERALTNFIFVVEFVPKRSERRRSRRPRAAPAITYPGRRARARPTISTTYILYIELI
ncbi:hypothetical protein EVAR_8995_1 [Eumeta japonica]|uniref:Uncharacterized protein n=1 Tax=Eumeta variegata TaxID=151549 RepID=A0A4C1WPA6_EUMVA|nr:hypothetical protein EVAR_8995_1 [Eumeta japonica]